MKWHGLARKHRQRYRNHLAALRGSAAVVCRGLMSRDVNFRWTNAGTDGHWKSKDEKRCFTQQGSMDFLLRLDDNSKITTRGYMWHENSVIP